MNYIKESGPLVKIYAGIVAAGALVGLLYAGARKHRKISEQRKSDAVSKTFTQDALNAAYDATLVAGNAVGGALIGGGYAATLPLAFPAHWYWMQRQQQLNKSN